MSPSPTDRPAPRCAVFGCECHAVAWDALCEGHVVEVTLFRGWLFDDDGCRGFERARSIWTVNMSYHGHTYD